MSQVSSDEKVECAESDPCSDDETTVFNDPIHGHIELPKKCVQIINTPEFLRLRHIKQLGAAYEVFPGAAHNRFEHSLGVCHLAGTFGKHLKQQIDREIGKNTPGYTEKVKVTKEDILCLQIAGLCHDLGHGPMSHPFQSHFIRKQDAKNKAWKHEENSRKMFDYLVDKHNIIQINSKDREFIKQLIHRDDEGKDETGRSEEKDFLYEIISNDENGIDVDKWDYFARDSYHLGIGNNFDHDRLIKFSRVLEVDGRWHVCYRDKQAEDIYQMYLSRVNLHRRAYQHKTVRILERMYMEALQKADEHYKMTSRDGKTELKLSECIREPELFSQLTDHVFHNIRISNNEELKEARDILELIDTRKQYKLVSEALPIQDKEEVLLNIFQSSELPDEKQILEEIVKHSNGKLTQGNLLVDIAFFDLGKKKNKKKKEEEKKEGDNPVDNVHFYKKTAQGQKYYSTFHLKREDISHMLPEVYSEYLIRLYIKKANEKLLEEAKVCFEAWCKTRNIGRNMKVSKPACG